MKKKQPYRIIVAGSRTFSDYAFLKAKLDRLTCNLQDFVIVSGAAKGADRLGERYADENGKTVIRFHADWDGLGKKAGILRNEEMVSMSGAKALVAFRCEGKSTGTDDVIARARKAGLKVIVYNVRRTT